MNVFYYKDGTPDGYSWWAIERSDRHYANFRYYALLRRFTQFKSLREEGFSVSKKSNNERDIQLLIEAIFDARDFKVQDT
jgi:hypothetical protein